MSLGRQSRWPPREGEGGGRHSHKVRKRKRRKDAVLKEERERHEPPPSPVSEEHAAIRERIERGLAALLGGPVDPEREDLSDKRLNERIAENPDLANDAAQLVGLMREEQEFLHSLGIDPRPYDRYEPKF